MTRGPADHLLQRLRTLVTAENGGVADRELLERFGRGDEAAFEALVQRHGPLVWRVCRGVLRDQHLAEDAFQATFLLLVRKRADIRKQPSVGSWLYKVAYRVALRARRAAAPRIPPPAITRPEPDPADAATWHDLQAVFDAELQRLPEKFRAPIVLCCLEGWTRDEAAQHLGWTVGTLKGRLERGREVLRARLVRRGLAPGVALAACLLSPDALRAALPPALAAATARAARALATGAATAGLISARTWTLVRGVSRTMLLTNLKLTAVLLLFLSAAGLGLVGFPQGTPEEPKAAPAPLAGAPAPAREQLPPGAVARLGTTHFRHMHTIKAAAYSADGRRLFSGSWDGTARLWDAATGKELLKVSGTGEGFSTVAISPDGRVLAGGIMKRALFLWDAATGNEIRRIENLENTPFGLTFSTDGQRLAAVSGSVVHVWDVTSGQELTRFSAPRGDLRPFTFGPDLRTIATREANNTIRFWDLATGREGRTVPTGQADLGPLALSPDGKTLATGGGKADRTVRLWDVATGQERRRFGPHAAGTDSLTFSPDGQTLAVGESAGAFHLYEVATGQERGHGSLRPGSWVLALALSPDGKTLAAGGTDDKTLHLYDTATGRERHVSAGHQNEVTATALTPDGRTLISAGKDGVVCLWDWRAARELRRWSAGPHGIEALAVAPDGQSVFLAAEPVLRQHDLQTGRVLREFRGHKGTPGGLALSPDGATLASGGWEDHLIRLWDVATGKERLQIPLPKPNGQNYGDIPLAFTADGKLLISGSADRTNNALYLWDVATGQERQRAPQQVSRFALAPDGRTLATAGWGGRIHLWELPSLKPAGEFVASGGALAFSPDGRMVACGGTDGVIHLWELAANQERRAFAGHQPGGNSTGSFAAGVAALTFAPDGRTLISGGGDTTLVIWDLLARPAAAREAPPLETLWADLVGAAPRAFDALAALVATPAETAAFLTTHLASAAPVDPARLDQWIADLGNAQFAVREAAVRALGEVDDLAAPALRAALARPLAVEARRRLEEVLGRLEGPATGDRLRQLRAVEVLEHLGTPAARTVLQALAQGTPAARLTQEAQRALGRLPKG